MPPTIPKKENATLTRFLNSETQVDRETRTIKFSFSSRKPVERWAWYNDDLPEGASNVFEEVLSQNAADWNLERVSSKVCPYLKNHDRNQKLGQVTSVSFDGDRGYCEVKLRRTKEAIDHMDDIEDRTAGGVSFGYIVGKYTVLSPAKYEYDEDKGYKVLTKKAVLEGSQITLLEISNEEIPADASVGYGKSFVNLRTVTIDGEPNFTFEEQQNMPPENDNLVQLKTQVDTLTAERDRLSKDLVNELSERQMLQGKYDELLRDRDQLSAQNRELVQQAEQRDAKIALLEKREFVSNSYYSLRSKAEELVNSAYLSSAEFNDLFGETQADIDKYVRADNAAIALGQIEFFVDKVSKRPKPLLKTVSDLANEPLPAREGVEPEVDSAKVQRLAEIARASRAY